ncbi:MAG: acyltransferase family protein, partial [Acidimicrobiales bacterium]
MPAPPAPDRGPDARLRVERLGYRPAFDGLRAIAVIPVLLFHASVTWARGGFLGVDVFFVLSGFLITRLLLEERELTGRIALLRFYLRRVLRLFPALVAVSVASLVYATVWLDHGQAVRAAHDLFAAATYRMNWVEALHAQPPFGLLDHTWSLSIEEQFYLLWPLGLLLAYRLGRGRGVFVAALGGAALSAGVRALLWHGGQPVHRVYYGLDTHADGLLLGCALAAVTLYRPGPLREALRGASGRVAGRWAGPVALAMLALAASQTALFSKGLPSWGYPIVGVLTAIVIADVWAGGVLDRALRPTALVAIGRISYGLYLWHWPVFLVLNPARTHWSPFPLTLLRLAVTFAVAVVSFFAVEQPFLRLKRHFEPADRLSEPTFDPQPDLEADPQAQADPERAPAPTPHPNR